MNTVEFKLHIQNIKGKNIVDNFIEKIKDGFKRKGIQKDVDYTIRVINNSNIVKRDSNVMYGGASDSTFPYSIIEGLLDYIDGNVRALKPENIRSDDYVKTQEAKKRTLDGLFSKGDMIDASVNIENVSNDNQTTQQSSSTSNIKTWNDLMTSRTTQQPPPPQPQSQTQPQQQQQENKDIDDVQIPNVKILNEETEYIVKITLNVKYVKTCIHSNMGKRELMKILE